MAGVDVGGLTRQQAEAELTARFADQSTVPVTFTAGDASFTFAANQLGVHPDWKAAVAAAARASDGFGPIRGFRRLRTRFFGAEVLPPIAVSNAALDFAPHGVRVNAVNPGVVVTELHTVTNAVPDYAGFLERSKTTHPIGRVGNVEEIATLILFLLSEEAGWITGVTYSIDGGRALMSAR